MRKRVVPFWFAVVLGAITFGAAPDPTTTPGPADSQKKTPSGFYLTYVAAAGQAKTVKDLEPFLSAKSIAAIGPKRGREALDELRHPDVTDVRVVNQTPDREGSYVLELEGTRRDDGLRLKGWARIVRERGTWRLEKDDWASPRPPSAPRIPGTVSVWGGATGELTVGAETAKLAHSWAREIPELTEKSRTGYWVLISDVPWKPADGDPAALAKSGALHAIELTIAPDMRLKETKLHDRGFEGAMLRPADAGRFEREQVGPDIVAGRVFIEAPETANGKTYYYAVTFRAPVEWKSRAADDRRLRARCATAAAPAA
ncbi:MAG: hypothetical protein ABI592_06690 [Acidobacteriota bacterium]